MKRISCFAFLMATVVCAIAQPAQIHRTPQNVYECGGLTPRKANQSILALHETISADEARKFLFCGADPNLKLSTFVDDNSGLRLLDLAVAAGNMGLLDALLDSNVEMNYLHEDGRSALHQAVAIQSPAVEKLLMHGADPNYGPAGSTRPIFIAASNGSLEMVKLLVEGGADVNVSHIFNGGKASPIYLAQDYPEIFSYLIGKGASPDIYIDANNETPLLIALLSESKFDLMEAALKGGANPNMPVKNGSTPLHLAVKWRDAKAVRLLLKYGASLDKKNVNGESIADYAEQSTEEIRALLRNSDT